MKGILFTRHIKKLEINGNVQYVKLINIIILKIKLFQSQKNNVQLVWTKPHMLLVIQFLMAEN